MFNCSSKLHMRRAGSCSRSSMDQMDECRGAGRSNRPSVESRSAITAALRHWLSRNAGPGSSRTSPTTQLRPEMRPLTPGQVAQPLEFVARDPALRLYLTLATTTGARRGQLLGLRWIDVDLVGGSVRHRNRRTSGRGLRLRSDGSEVPPNEAQRDMSHLDMAASNWDTCSQVFRRLGAIRKREPASHRRRVLTRGSASLTACSQNGMESTSSHKASYMGFAAVGRQIPFNTLSRIGSR
jgi:integrase